jgi:hypothetical protein
MLHMQHAHVVSLLIRQHEAARLKAERDVLAKARRAAAAAADPGIEPGRVRTVRKVPVPGPRAV